MAWRDFATRGWLCKGAAIKKIAPAAHKAGAIEMQPLADST